MKTKTQSLLIVTFFIAVILSCEKDEKLISEEVLGTYYYTTDTAGTGEGNLVDNGELEITLLEMDSEKKIVKYTFNEISSINSSQRKYTVDLIVANFDPILIFLVKSQQNQASINTELISGTGGYQFIVDGQTELIDGFFDTSNGSVTIRYTLSSSQSTKLVSLKGEKVNN